MQDMEPATQKDAIDASRKERTLLIINPVSGKMKSKTGLFDILDELYHQMRGTPRDDRLVTVHPTMKRGDAIAYAADAAADGFDHVICCGGDGTLNETVNGLMRIPAADRLSLGYIPAGSTNDFAASIGLPNSLRACARIASDTDGQPLDIGHFSPTDPALASQARFFTYIATFGAFTEASYITPQSTKNVLGHLAYLLAGVAEIANIQPHRLAMELADGRRTQGEYIFGAVANTVSAGGVVRLPAAEVSMTDGKLEVLLIRRPRNPADLNRIITSLLASDYKDNPMIEFYHSEGARFKLEVPLRWSLDGEEGHGGTEVNITCHAGAVRLARA